MNRSSIDWVWFKTGNGGSAEMLDQAAQNKYRTNKNNRKALHPNTYKYMQDHARSHFIFHTIGHRTIGYSSRYHVT